MRGVSTWAVAVRRQDGEIEVTSEPLVSWAKRHRALRWPVIRGFVALVESLKIGTRALAFSANAQQEDDEHGEREEIGGVVWGLTVAASFALAIGLFFVVPVDDHEPVQGRARLGGRSSGSSRACCGRRSSSATSSRSAGCPDLRRVFEYHGAEHKTISCFEAGDRLVPARAEIYSRFHPRCGTSFLLIVMVLAIFVFAPLGLPEWYWLVLSRILGIPLDRRPLLRGDQVGRAPPRPPLGAGADVAGPDAPEPHHPRARPRAARGRDRGPRRRPRGRGPRGGGRRRGPDRDRRLRSRSPRPSRGGRRRCRRPTRSASVDREHRSRTDVAGCRVRPASRRSGTRSRRRPRSRSAIPPGPLIRRLREAISGDWSQLTAAADLVDAGDGRVSRCVLAVEFECRPAVSNASPVNGTVWRHDLE